MKNKFLKVLFFYNGLFVLASGLLGPLYALYIAGINGGVLAVSISWAAFLGSSTFFTYLVSKTRDQRKKEKKMLLAGIAIRALAWLLFAFTGSIIVVVILQIFIGLGEALGTPAFDTLFAEHLEARHHLQEYSRWKISDHREQIKTLINESCGEAGSRGSGLAKVSIKNRPDRQTLDFRNHSAWWVGLPLLLFFLVASSEEAAGPRQP